MSDALMHTIRQLYADVSSCAAGGVNLDMLREFVGAEHVVMTRVRGDMPDWRACGHFGPVDGHVELAQWMTLADHEALASRSVPGRPLRTSAFLSASQMRRSSLYQDVLRPLNGGLAALVYSRNATGWTGISYCRSLARGHDFDNEELAAIQALAPDIDNIEAVQARLQQAQVQADAAHDMLHLATQAIILLDAGARPVFLNRSAERLLAAAGDGLRLDARGIRARTAPDDRRLQHAIRTALRLSPESRGPLQREDLGSALPLTVHRPPPRRPWILSVVPASCLSARAMQGGAQVAVLIHNPDDAGLISASRLMDAYGLTRREAQLSALLGQGEDLAAAAARLALSAGTARQYLKQIFRKVGVQRQAELVRVLIGSFPRA